MVAPAPVVARGEQGQAGLRRLHRRAGGGAREPRQTAEIERRRRVNAEGMLGLGQVLGHARLRAGRAGRRELPVRGHRLRHAAALRGAAPGRRDRSTPPRLRCAERDPGHRGHARRARVLRCGSRPVRRQRARALTSRRDAAIDPRPPAGRPPLLAELPAALLGGSDLRSRHVDRRHRPDPRRRDAHRSLGRLGRGAPDRRLPAGGRDRAPARAARRPALAEGPAHLRGRRPAERLRSARARRPAVADRRPRLLRRDRDRVRPAGGVRGAPESRRRRAAAAGELADANGGAADDDDRDADRRRRRRCLGPRPRVLAERRQLPALGQPAATGFRRACSSKAALPARDTGETSRRESGSFDARVRC